MKMKPLGKTGLKVSEIGFGCMSLGNDQKTNTSLLLDAFDHGINFFDTADRYDDGWNEETVGQALKEIRKNVVIATKVGHRKKKDGSGWEWKPTGEYILSAVDKSLQRLQTGYIDLYQLHGGTLEDPIEEIIGAFEQLRETGKIRSYGISSIRPNVIREYIKRSNITSVMIQYSLLDRRPEESCLDLLYDSDVSVITRGSLAKGLLIDKVPGQILNYSEADVAVMQKAVNATGNPVGASLQFVLQHPAVTTSAVGLRTVKQLEEVIEGYDRQVTSEQLRKLAGILDANVYQQHR